MMVVCIIYYGYDSYPLVNSQLDPGSCRGWKTSETMEKWVIFMVQLLIYWRVGVITIATSMGEWHRHRLLEVRQPLCGQIFHLRSSTAIDFCRRLPT